MNGKDQRPSGPRINERIRARAVLLIDETGKNMGVVPIFRAQQVAHERGLDLVEIQPNANPPVCKILDYGKYRYQEKRQKRDAKKKQHTQEEKEIRLRPNTAPHDIETKVRHAKNLLEDGNRVIFSILLRGREREHDELARAVFEKVKQAILPAAKLEQDVRREGHRMTLVLTPLPKSKRPVNPPPPTSRGQASVAAPAAPHVTAPPPTAITGAGGPTG